MKHFSSTTPSFELSIHAQKRCQQRAIPEWAITKVLQLGEVIYKQGLTFHYLTRRDILDVIDPSMQERLFNLVVIRDKNGEIITAYRHKEGVKKVKRKEKRLRKAPVFLLHNKALISSLHAA
jgi:hypothetical protein